jgi:hypothetical protein
MRGLVLVSTKDVSNTVLHCQGKGLAYPPSYRVNHDHLTTTILLASLLHTSNVAYFNDAFSFRQLFHAH